jgi:hypothetical protein
MPTPALVLLGFMPMQFGMSYLLQRSVSNRSSNDAKRLWLVAKSRIGAAEPNAGCPEVLELPENAKTHLDAAANNPHFLEAVKDGDLQGMPWSFKLVEIAPLIAFQFAVETERAGMLAPPGSDPPSIDEMLAIALPDRQETLPIEGSITGTPAKGRLELRSPSLNVRAMKAGLLNGPGEDAGPWDLLTAGVGFGVSLPLVQVVRFEGRCYLRNGYHRAFALGTRGATHIPCVFLEADRWERIGARGQGGTFDRKELRVSNPPTMNHFLTGRAVQVDLWTPRRVIRVTWEETLEVEAPQLR